jgi:DNA-binding CsgD family transcriptional regulator/pimeloyl-ACP methyl ester carboxylesterase
MVWPGESPAFVQAISPGGAPMLVTAQLDSTLVSVSRFAQGRSFVWFDWRGTGQSDRRPAQSIGELVLDLEAVISALGERPDLISPNSGCFPACTFVAQHADACRSLFLLDPMIRKSESPQGTFTRGGYHDYDSFIYSLARNFFPNLLKEEFSALAREWAGQIPEDVHRTYMGIVDAADLSTTLPSIRLPTLVLKSIPSSAGGQVAALIPGSVLVKRDHGYLGQRLRADWDEHIGSKFGHSAKPAATVSNGLLTEQEHKVVALIAEGRTNAQIAEALTIAESTAARHVHNVLTKLGVSNRVEAAAWWLERRR